MIFKYKRAKLKRLRIIQIVLFLLTALSYVDTASALVQIPYASPLIPYCAQMLFASDRLVSSNPQPTLKFRAPPYDLLFVLPPGVYCEVNSKHIPLRQQADA